MKISIMAEGILVLLIPSGIFAGSSVQELAMALSPAQSAGEERPALLAAPTALKLVIVPSGFRLSWQPAPQETGRVTGYEIVRATIFSGPYEAVARVGKGVLSYTDTTAKPEHIYFYKVRALAGAEYSPFSGAATGEMPGTP